LFCAKIRACSPLAQRHTEPLASRHSDRQKVKATVAHQLRQPTGNVALHDHVQNFAAIFNGPVDEFLILPDMANCRVHGTA
jgi:hypothetical protein